MEEHNEITRRTCALALAVHRAGGEFIIENPVDRSDADLFCRMMVRTDCSRSIARMHHESHGALWRMPCVRELQAETDAAQLHLPQCAFGALRQKWTTLLCSPCIAEALGDVSKTRCDCASHVQSGSGDESLSKAAAYPAALNRRLARAFAACPPRDGA